MKKGLKLAFVVAAGSLAVAANAFQYYNLASGDLGLIGQSNSDTLHVGGPAIGVQGDTTNGQIDFFAGHSLIAGDSSGVGFQTYSFTYQVLAPNQVPSVGLVMLGSISGAGRVSFEEDVFRINADNSETMVGSISNTLTSSGLVGDAGSATITGANYTFNGDTRLTQGLVSYKVKKSFFLQVTNWGTQGFNAANDYVSIGVIQQNHQGVPEPTSIAALAIGALTLAARRRRRA